jgi:hypothetical protein
VCAADCAWEGKITRENLKSQEQEPPTNLPLFREIREGDVFFRPGPWRGRQDAVLFYRMCVYQRLCWPGKLVEKRGGEREKQ